MPERFVTIWSKGITKRLRALFLASLSMANTRGGITTEKVRRRLLTLKRSGQMWNRQVMELCKQTFVSGDGGQQNGARVVIGVKLAATGLQANANVCCVCDQVAVC